MRGEKLQNAGPDNADNAGSSKQSPDAGKSRQEERNTGHAANVTMDSPNVPYSVCHLVNCYPSWRFGPSRY